MQILEVGNYQYYFLLCQDFGITVSTAAFTVYFVATICKVEQKTPVALPQEQENESDSADEPIDLREDLSADPSVEAAPSTTTSAGADNTSNEVLEKIPVAILPSEKDETEAVKVTYESP